MCIINHKYDLSLQLEKKKLINFIWYLFFIFAIILKMAIWTSAMKFKKKIQGGNYTLTWAGHGNLQNFKNFTVLSLQIENFLII